MKDFNNGTSAAIVWIFTIVVTIISLVLARNIIQPNNFWSLIAFLIVWGLFSGIGYFIALVIVGLFNKK